MLRPVVLSLCQAKDCSQGLHLWGWCENLRPNLPCHQPFSVRLASLLKQILLRNPDLGFPISYPQNPDPEISISYFGSRDGHSDGRRARWTRMATRLARGRASRRARARRMSRRKRRRRSRRRRRRSRRVRHRLRRTRSRSTCERRRGVTSDVRL